MTNEFNEHVEKIVSNYLNRLKSHLKGFPASDRDELVREIHSHIYESFRSDPTEDEIERILHVLEKLGEPADVVSSRLSPSLVDMGKKKKLPLYILAGVLIGLLGLPLGLGGIALVIAILCTVGAFIFAYYVTAITLVVSGWIAFIASLIRLFNPDFLTEYIHIYNGVIDDPQLAAIAGIVSSILVAALGLGMLWLGKYMMRGLRFLGNSVVDGIRRLRRKKR